MLSPSSVCLTNPSPNPCFLNQKSDNRGFQFCCRARPWRGIGRNLRSMERCETGKPNLCAEGRSERVAERVERLSVEFGSLSEPIERVRRLLEYAALVGPLSEEERGPESRVRGCSTQVWVHATLDRSGRLRFRGDSDSEITKGFLSCLLWALDGAHPSEVAAVRPHHLHAMNVGLYGKATSRVNAWHNVLLTMQTRAQALLARAHTQPFSTSPD